MEVRKENEWLGRTEYALRSHRRRDTTTPHTTHNGIILISVSVNEESQ